MIVNLSKEHSLVSNWVAELRDVDVQNDRMRFRRNLERIGEVAAYEISKRMPYVEKEIQTPVGRLNWSALSLPFIWPLFRSMKEKIEDSTDAVADGVKGIDFERYTKPLRKRWKSWIG